MRGGKSARKLLGVGGHRSRLFRASIMSGVKNKRNQSSNGEEIERLGESG